MDGLLKDRVAVITGAAREQGIGLATAKIFIEHGAKVALFDLPAENPAGAAKVLGENAVGIECNVMSKESCIAGAAKVAEKWGRIDVLVNNAGITQRRKVADITEEDFDLVNGVVFKGTLLMVQAVLPHMPRNENAAIVNISSLSALQGGGIFGGPHYCGAKAGVLGLSRAMAKEFGPEGIRVNAVAPGLIMTDFSRRGPSADAGKIEAGKAFPLGRVGRPSDIGNVALFLASDLSGFMTGTTLNVNGGDFIA
ncbi:MAG: SDR family oxidoreductase [Alphaproteobacteria bacterium]|nr:MAG: SDR family oxidoreductase [Alphaproteobacteria bacterium]